MTYQILVVLHVLSAMTWFGAGLGLPRRVRLGIARGRPAAQEAADDVLRGLRLAAVFGVVTIATGLALIFVGGGFGMFGPRIHTGIVLALAALGLTWLGVRPAWGQVKRIAGSEEPLEGATRHAKRAAMLHGMTHGLLVVTLALMLWRL